MSISFGSYFTCFLAIVFLTIYLDIILYHTKGFFGSSTKYIFAGIIVICIRLVIPVNFPFTYSLYSEHILPFFTDVLWTEPLAHQDIMVADILKGIWAAGCIVGFCFLIHRKHRLHRFLKKYARPVSGRIPVSADLQELLDRHNIRLVTVPAAISPAITGLLHPVILLPESLSLSEHEWEYILRHEIRHCQSHDLWVKFLLELVACANWWNPCVYLMIKEYSLTLEVTNDNFLKKNSPHFDTLVYAELLTKIARFSMCSLSSADAITFVGHRCSNLATRIGILLNTQDSKKSKKLVQKLNYLLLIIIITASYLIVAEPSSPIPPEDKVNSFNLEEDDVYLRETEGGFDLYVNDKYYDTLLEIPKDFEHVKLYTN